MILRSRRCYFVLVAWSVLALAGCGGVPVNSTSVTTPASTSSALAGNWLLYGSMPHEQTTGAPTEGFAMDVQVTGTQILASARVQGSCSATSSFGITYGAVLTGVIAPDGTFTITQPSQSTVATIVVKGSVPAAAGAAWPGTYAVTFSGLGACSTTQNGAFTATSFPQLTGTYTGGGSVYPPSGGTGPLAVIASVALQEGSPLYLNGVPTSSTLGLGGSIKVQGFPCFSSGTISTAMPSILAGNQAGAYFTMNDGSTLQLFADITDTSGNTLSVKSFFVSSGLCAGFYPALTTPLLLSR